MFTAIQPVMKRGYQAVLSLPRGILWHASMTELNDHAGHVVIRLPLFYFFHQLVEDFLC